MTPSKCQYSVGADTKIIAAATGADDREFGGIVGFAEECSALPSLLRFFSSCLFFFFFFPFFFVFLFFRLFSFFLFFTFFLFLGAFSKQRVFLASALASATFPSSNFGSPGRRETMKIAIFCRRGHQKHEKRRHQNHEKAPPGETYFGSWPPFLTSLPAHSVKKRAGAWHFLVRTRSVTHPSRLKTSIFF